MNFIARRREVGGPPARIRGAARLRARHQEPHARPSRSLSRSLRGKRLLAPGRPGALCRDGRRTPAQIILDICRGVGAKTVTKGKSMVAEEIGLNDFLEANGITPVETDLGEYIIQLRHELPSPHHRARGAPHQGAGRGRLPPRPHRICPPTAISTEPTSLLAEARGVLREKFLAADVGITGANFLVAETGTSMIVTNEGNGDLTQTLPRVAHRARLDREAGADAGGRWRSCCACWRARRPARKCRSTRRSPPARAAPGDPDGPGEYHVVLLDNGRSSMLGGAVPATCCAASAAAPA